MMIDQWTFVDMDAALAQVLPSLMRLQMRYLDELRTPLLTDFLWVFDRLVVPRRFCCRLCVKVERCVRSTQQMLTCMGYWHWEVAREGRDLVDFAQVPLTRKDLASKSLLELVGVYRAHQFTLMTLGNVSKCAVRQRLLDIAQDTSITRLTAFQEPCTLPLVDSSIHEDEQHGAN